MMGSVETAHLAAARSGNQLAFGELVEPYRHELEVHCYRLLGSFHDAEEIVQETLLRAWRRLDNFEGRAPIRAWLYKIATNACFDVIRARPRRTLPIVAHPATDPDAPFAPPAAESLWLEPFPDDLLAGVATSPEARYDIYESISLAFLAVLQLLPHRQRAVLVLRDVLSWRAQEVAELLDMTVPAVNSALHRARATLERDGVHSRDAQLPPDDPAVRVLLDRYVRAWEAADMKGLIALLREDAAYSMPPIPTWYRGRAAISAFLGAHVFGTLEDTLPRAWRLRQTRANGQPALALFRRNPSGVGYSAVGLQLLRFEAALIAEVTTFLDPRLVARFGVEDEGD
jgi:RNA polymerase sigma-70 factor, ECF subfamily